VGQYHWPVNLTKKQFLDPHKFGDGLKLLEFGCSESGTLMALTYLLASSVARGGGDMPAGKLAGTWAGDKIAIIGDYSEKDDIKGVNAEQIAKHVCKSTGGYEDISAAVIEELKGYGIRSGSFGGSFGG